MNICILIHLLLNNISYGQCIDEWRYGFFEIENFIDSNGDTLNQSDSRGYHQGMHVYFEYEKITNTKWGAYTKGRYLDGKPIGDWKEHHLNGSYAVGKFNSGEECRTINGKFDCKKQGIYKKIGLWKCYNVFGKLIGEVYFDSIKSMDQLKNSIDEPYRSLYLTHIKDTIEIIPVNKIDDYNKSNIISLKPLSLNEVIGKYGTSYHMSYWSVVSRWSDKGPISHIEKEVTYRELGFTFRFHSDDTLKYYIISNKAKCKVYPNIILGKTTVSDLFKSLGESEIDENYDNSRKYTYFKYGDLLFGVKALTLFGNVPFKSRLKKKVIKRIKIIY
jgi:hypothetical protein